MDATKLALIVGVFVFAMMIPACEPPSNFRVDPSGRAPEARARTEVAEPWVNAPIVSFIDPGLEAAIRSATGVLTRDITTVDLEAMTFLDASSRGITDLEGIQYCIGLEWLELGDNELADISRIADLSLLRSLNLRDNQISDIGALSELPYLWLLDLSRNPIVDMMPLVRNEEFGDGDRIVLQGSRPEAQATQAIEDLKQRGVGVLYAAFSVVTFPDPGLDSAIREAIGKLTGDILDIYLVGLVFLDANNRNISSLEGIRHCADLEKLLLRGSGIADLAPLLSLDELQWLDLSDNEYVDFGVLSRLSQLTELWLAGNEIVDISALKGLTNLRTLYLSDNNIVDIAALSELTNLWLLGLEDNRIVDISELSGLANLEMLILGNNDISDINALATLPNLRQLYLNQNRLDDISVLEGLIDLKTVDLSMNHIADIQMLVDNPGITSMDWVDLRHNDLDLSRRSPDKLNIESLEGRGVYVDFYPQN